MYSNAIFCAWLSAPMGSEGHSLVVWCSGNVYFFLAAGILVKVRGLQRSFFPQVSSAKILSGSNRNLHVKTHLDTHFVAFGDQVQGLADYLGQYARDNGAQSLEDPHVGSADQFDTCKACTKHAQSVQYPGDIMLLYGSVGRHLADLSRPKWPSCKSILKYSQRVELDVTVPTRNASDIVPVHNIWN